MGREGYCWLDTLVNYLARRKDDFLDKLDDFWVEKVLRRVLVKIIDQCPSLIADVAPKLTYVMVPQYNGTNDIGHVSVPVNDLLVFTGTHCDAIEFTRRIIDKAPEGPGELSGLRWINILELEPVTEDEDEQPGGMYRLNTSASVTRIKKL